jgi:hypothetical protein
MDLRPVIQGLAAIWLVLFLVSFVALEAGEADDFASGLNRVATFLTWQVLAFVVAAAGAFATRQAVARGAARVKLLGYVPLAVSVFLVASFIAIFGYRIFVAPLFSAES